MFEGRTPSNSQPAPVCSALSAEVRALLTSTQLRDENVSRHGDLLTFLSERKAQWASLTKRHGQESVIEVLLNDKSLESSSRQCLECSDDKLRAHFRLKENQTLAEAGRILGFFQADAMFAELFGGELSTWQGSTAERVAIAARLGAALVRYPQALQSAVLLSAQYLSSSESTGSSSAGELNHTVQQFLRALLKEHHSIMVPVLTYHLRRTVDTNCDPALARTMCKLLLQTGVSGSGNAEALFRTALGQKMPNDLRAEVFQQLGNFRQWYAGDLICRQMCEFRPDGESESLVPFLRIVESGLRDPNSYMAIKVIERGLYYLMGGTTTYPTGDVPARLADFVARYPDIPKQFVLPILGHVDGDKPRLTRFNHFCSAVGKLPEGDQAKVWEDCRTCLLSWGVYRRSVMKDLLDSPGVEDVKNALEIGRFMGTLSPAATLAERSGAPFVLPDRADWVEANKALHRTIVSLWRSSCSTHSLGQAYLVAARDLQPQSDYSLPLSVPSFKHQLRNIDPDSHPLYLPMFLHAEEHWTYAHNRHVCELVDLIKCLDPPTYERFRSWRYDCSDKVVREQIGHLNSEQRGAWTSEHVGWTASAQAFSGDSRFRLLVTDLPSILFFAGETPLGCASCLHHAGNPLLNRALLALVADAHQRMGLLIDTERLSEAVLNCPQEGLDVYAEEIRRACVARVIIKLGMNSEGAPVLVRGPIYFPKGRRDKTQAKILQQDIVAWSERQAGLEVFSEAKQGAGATVLSIPPSRISAGQNEDYDGISWSSTIRGRIYLSMRKEH